MFTIYEYTHDAVSHVTVAYLVREEPSEHPGVPFVAVQSVADLKAARAYASARIPQVMRTMTEQDYAVSEKKHSLGVLCISAET